MAELLLRKERNEDALHTGGSVTYRVYDGDRWVGWVGDGRKFNGSRYTARKWWACWREDGDTAARWSTGLRFDNRAAAVDALAARIAGGVDALPEFGYERRYHDLCVAVEHATNAMREGLARARKQQAAEALGGLLHQLYLGETYGYQGALHRLYLATDGEFGEDPENPVPVEPQAPEATGGEA